jgi:four helix bundle suffix protein
VASGTSKEMEIKLTNVARASLEELMADYRDFLRVRDLDEWDRAHPYARRLGELLRTPGACYQTFKPAVEHPEPSISANAILGLAKVTSVLLMRQIATLERKFVEEGGMRERMTRARVEQRRR